MGIESIIFDRLNDASITDFVSSRIYVTDPNQETVWPFIVYDCEAADPTVTLSGDAGIQTYTVTIDIWARSVTQRRAIESAVKARLHPYRGGSVQLSRLSSEAAEEIGDGDEGDVYHAQQTYSVIVTSATIQATTDSTGVVRTGANSVTLSACDHQLTLTCSGLKLDGVTVGATGPAGATGAAGPNTVTTSTTTPLTGFLIGNGSNVGTAGTLVLTSGVPTFTNSAATTTGGTASYTDTTAVRRLAINDRGALVWYQSWGDEMAYLGPNRSNASVWENTLPFGGTNPDGYYRWTVTGRSEFVMGNFFGDLFGLAINLDTGPNGSVSTNHDFRVSGTTKRTLIGRGVANGSEAAQLHVRATTTGTVGQLIQVQNGASANAVEVKTVGGTLLARIDPSGTVYANEFRSLDGVTFVVDGSATVTANAVNCTTLTTSGGIGCDSLSATVVSTGFLRCGATDNTDPTGNAVVGRMPIYDGGGTLLGYMPIYSP